jgi:uncharacterized coiled-coil DUF342 family protein
MSSEDEKLEKLETQAAMLKNSRNELYKTLNIKKGERDRFNDSARELREEAKKHRDQRNEINEKVQNIKIKLEFHFEKLEKKLGKLNQFSEEIQTEIRSKPRKSKIKDDLRRIEWEIMTTPTIDLKEKEDELISRANRLRKALGELNILEKQEDKKIDILADIKVTEIEIREIRNQINNLSKQSQEHHEKMISLFEQADKEREKANEVHKRYIENVEKINTVNKKLDTIMPQIKALRKGLKIQDLRALEERKISIQSQLEVKRQESLRKLEKGEKLSFEELRLIYGEEEE